MTISDRAINKLREDKNSLNELAIIFKKSEATIRRWVFKKDSRLTTLDAIKYIKGKTGLTQSEIIS